MKTTMSIIQEIQDASDNDDMFGLISIHNDLLHENVSLVTNALTLLKRNDEVSFEAFSFASGLSKLDKNGIMKRIIANAIRREGIYD